MRQSIVLKFFIVDKYAHAHAHLLHLRNTVSQKDPVDDPGIGTLDWFRSFSIKKNFL